MTIELDFLIIVYISFMNIAILLGLYSYFQYEIYNLKNEIVYVNYKNKEFEKRLENLECEPTLMF
jgi:cell division protein FtsL